MFLLYKNNRVFSTIVKCIFNQQERSVNSKVTRSGEAWTNEESIKLIELAKTHKRDWQKIQVYFQNRTLKAITSRFRLLLKKSLENGMESKQPWSMEEDRLLIKLRQMHGPHWDIILKSFPNRNVIEMEKQYARLQEHKRGPWSEEEISRLQHLSSLYGKDFEKISSLMVTRTAEQCRAGFVYFFNCTPTTALNQIQIERLKNAFKDYGTNNIKLVIQKAKLPVSKSNEEKIREFYWRELDPNIVRSEWTQQEMLTMAQLYDELDCMELVQSRLPRKRGLKDMWLHYTKYTLDKQGKKENE